MFPKPQGNIEHSYWYGHAFQNETWPAADQRDQFGADSASARTYLWALWRVFEESKQLQAKGRSTGLRLAMPV